MNSIQFFRNLPVTSLLWRCDLDGELPHLHSYHIFLYLFTQSCERQFVVLLWCPMLFYVFVFNLCLACRNVLLNCVLVYFSVLTVLAFICTVFLSCDGGHFSVKFNIVVKVQGLASHKTRFNPPFFLKMSCTKSWKWQLLSYSLFLCVLHCHLYFVHFSVSVVSLFSPYCWCVSLGLSL